jgi:hypothetical protein
MPLLGRLCAITTPGGGSGTRPGAITAADGVSGGKSLVDGMWSANNAIGLPTRTAKNSE